MGKRLQSLLQHFIWGGNTLLPPNFSYTKKLNFFTTFYRQFSLPLSGVKRQKVLSKPEVEQSVWISQLSLWSRQLKTAAETEWLNTKRKRHRKTGGKKMNWTVQVPTACAANILEEVLGEVMHAVKWKKNSPCGAMLDCFRKRNNDEVSWTLLPV